MTQTELNKILELHAKWLNEEPDGERADLRGANLREADLTGADLQYADLREADLYGANLRRANLNGANLRGADLYGANLREADLYGADLYEADLRGADLRYANLNGANLQGVNLRGTNLDYSCWPLCCGGLHVKIDKRIAAQLAYHFCAQECDDPEYIKARNAILWFANQFHRVDECGELEEKEG